MASPTVLTNSDNVRIFGSDIDMVYIAPLGTTLPETLDSLDPAFVPLGWLGDDGIDFDADDDNVEINAHQGGAIVRSKITKAADNITFRALEDTPATNQFVETTEKVTTTADVSRVDFAAGFRNVSVAAVVDLRDDSTGVTERRVYSRVDQTERPKWTASNKDAKILEIKVKRIGKSYKLTNNPTYKPKQA